MLHKPFFYNLIPSLREGRGQDQLIEQIKNTIATHFYLDFWTLWGLAAQSFFFLRLFIQWYRSEKEKKIVVPLNFWWLGIIGAVMLFVYAIIRGDIVFILTSIIQLVIYYRNLVIAMREQNEPIYAQEFND